MKSMENKTLEELDNLENDYIARHWDTRGRHESDMERHRPCENCGSKTRSWNLLFSQI